jgi:hypothetical protein
MAAVNRHCRRPSHAADLLLRGFVPVARSLCRSDLSVSAPPPVHRFHIQGWGRADPSRWADSVAGRAEISPRSCSAISAPMASLQLITRRERTYRISFRRSHRAPSTIRAESRPLAAVSPDLPALRRLSTANLRECESPPASDSAGNIFAVQSCRHTYLPGSSLYMEVWRR